jgi:CDP-6-deoxy-D-xylo-4-hexulose-3-dehydrase
LQDVQDKLVLPEACPASRPSWFGFVLTCRPEIDCNALVSFIEQHRIQSRRLFAGNIVRHPCFDKMRKTGTGYRIAGSLDNTDMVTQRTFWLGVYPGMNDAMLDRMIEAVKAGVQQHET